MRPDRPQLFDTWEELEHEYAYKVQLVNYVGSFKTRELADRFVAATKAHRAQEAKAAPVKKK